MSKKLIRLITAISLLIITMPSVSMALPFSNMFVLGDSLSDVGNLYAATDNNQLLPFPQLPQDPPYFQGRFSNGQNYTERLWQRLGLPGTVKPSLAGGTNYAVGGSRSRYHTFDRSINPTFDPLNPSTPTSFIDFTLLGQRDALLSTTGGVLDPGALYTIWTGSNDVLDAFEAVVQGAPQAYADALLFQSANDLLTVINELVAAGAKELLIPNVPNLGLVPGASGLPLATTLSQMFNSLVDAGLANINAEITRLDTFQFLTEVVNDPDIFNFTNVTDPCFTGFVGVPGIVCPNPDEYVFWDQIHPTAVTHGMLGDLAATAVPEPAIMILICSGLIGFGFARKQMAA